MSLLPLRGARRALSWIFLVTLSFFLLFFGGVFLEARNSIALTLNEISVNLRGAAEAFSIADTGETKHRLNEAQQNADKVLGQARWAKSMPIIGSFFAAAAELSNQSLELVRVLDEIAQNGFEWLFSDSRELTAKLQTLKEGSQEVDDLSAKIRTGAARCGMGDSF
ncbi:MAG: hypothetical protein HY536_00435, partial [Candidatus Colwellbacteria bacterium]|nr:hypothetical protein [Candidatus Colwellbacteria bacterium]